jgi:tRNA-dihydrouridine synthase A
MPNRRSATPPLSVAPMMRRTDRHFRYFLRQWTERTLLYTEMITTSALLRSDPDEYLGYHPDERPLALQLGGSDPTAMAECAAMAQERGFDEVNINIGCPSSRVQSGSIGVCLMAEPDTVAACVEAMREACSLPVTVKHRIGFDDRDSYDDMRDFVETVAAAGCYRFTIHARKAWLDGLSPAENRDVPPLRYEDVHRLQREFPWLDIEINGGIDTLSAAREHLEHVEAVMIGRAAWETPWIFADADREVFGDHDADPPSRFDVARAMVDYADRWCERGGNLQHVTDAMINLFSHSPGASAWRHHLAQNAHPDDAGSEVIDQALHKVLETRGEAA